jgi:hypothetical protein
MSGVCLVFGSGGRRGVREAGVAAVEVGSPQLDLPVTEHVDCSLDVNGLTFGGLDDLIRAGPESRWTRSGDRSLDSSTACRLGE